MRAPVLNTIEMRISLGCFLRRDGDQWVAVCPAVDVGSQGADKREAIQSVQEAVQLWFESCIERGTLPQALRELGFRTCGGPPPGGAGVVHLKHQRDEESVLGDSVPVTISIPAYQAALIRAGESCASC